MREIPLSMVCRWCEHQKYTISILSRILPQSSSLPVHEHRIQIHTLTQNTHHHCRPCVLNFVSKNNITNYSNGAEKAVEEKWWFFFVSHTFSAVTFQICVIFFHRQFWSFFPWQHMLETWVVVTYIFSCFYSYLTMSWQMLVHCIQYSIFSPF